ncbi:MAG: formyltransferase family protein [Verrucomicrobiota bacterium]
MANKQFSCVLLTGGDERLAKATEQYARSLFDVRHISRHGRDHKTLPAELLELLNQEKVDFLFNFLAPIIFPGTVLGAIGRASINFHPAPPEWPGVGSASFALYEKQATFGVTAHFMTERVDAGRIIRVQRFPILPNDTCERLFDRALDYMLLLFYEVLLEVSQNGEAAASDEQWKRKAITRRQFEKWMTLTPADSTEEIERKARALRHSRFPGPFLEIGGFRFELPPHKD